MQMDENEQFWWDEQETQNWKKNLDSGILCYKVKWYSPTPQKKETETHKIFWIHFQIRFYNSSMYFNSIF